MLSAFFVKYFGGRAAKAVMAGATGLISALIGPEVLHAIQGGVAEGLTPSAHEVGVWVGSALGAGVIFLLNHIPTYWKANKPD